MNFIAIESKYINMEKKISIRRLNDKYFENDWKAYNIWNSYNKFNKKYKNLKNGIWMMKECRSEWIAGKGDQ